MENCIQLWVSKHPRSLAGTHTKFPDTHGKSPTPLAPTAMQIAASVLRVLKVFSVIDVRKLAKSIVREKGHFGRKKLLTDLFRESHALRCVANHV